MKKINWNLISNIAVIGALISVLIGFTFIATQLKEYKQRLEALEYNYNLIENDFNELYEIDDGIKIVESR